MDWGYLYSHLVQSTGWTWEYIDDFMTLPRLWELESYWKTAPPTHVSAARIAYSLGAVPKEQAEAGAPPKSLEDFINDFMAAGGQVQVTGAATP